MANKESGGGVVDGGDDSVLRKIYFDHNHPAGYGTVAQLYAAARQLLPGVTHKRVHDWLLQQQAHTIHRRPTRRFPMRRTITSREGRQLQTDLIDVQSIKRENRGLRYILTAIDVFSRKAYAIPIKDKQSSTVANAFESAVLTHVVPVYVQSDKGTEFLGAPFQRLLQRYGVKFFTSTNPATKCALVERFHRTLRGRLAKYFSQHNTNSYYKVLDGMMHSSHGYAPNDVGEKNRRDVWYRLYGQALYADRQFTLEVGDCVRLVNRRAQWHRGYAEQFTEERFKISSRLMRDIPTYRVVDMEGSAIFGFFYAQELLRVPAPMPPATTTTPAAEKRPSSGTLAKRSKRKSKSA